MILLNEITDYLNINQVWPLNKKEQGTLLQIISPFAPHLAEELWEKLENKGSIFKSTWPAYDQKLIKDESINLVVQVNGKLRATLVVVADISETAALALAQENEIIKKWLENKEIVKVIFVPGKLLNIVIK